MRLRQLLWITAAPAVMACDAGLSGPAEGPFLGIQAERYLNEALDVMEFNSIRRYEIDWVAFRAQARAEAESAGSVVPADVYPAIEAALARIGDGHSFFRTPAELPAAAADGPPRVSPARTDPSTSLVVPGIGYLDVPAYGGGGAQGDSLAASYHRLIEAIDTLGTSCRWIVDLRGNTGGNMWPMLAGVGPVLGEDTVGYFIDPDSVVTAWTYEGGLARIDDLVVATSSPAYELVAPRPWVAVLTDGQTASSGEAIAVAFRGRPDARSFGDATWGVSTANAAFPLTDGAVIFLTVATMVDREGNVYGSELTPDEPVGGDKTGDPATDAVVAAAVSWLEGRSCG